MNLYSVHERCVYLRVIFYTFLLCTSSTLTTALRETTISEAIANAKSGPVLSLLEKFLSPSSEDAFFHFGDNSSTILPHMMYWQQYIGARGKYYVVYTAETDYDTLTTASTQPNTLLVRSTFSFLSPESSEIIDYDPNTNTDSISPVMKDAAAAVPDTEAKTTFNSLMVYMPTCPQVVHVSSADGLLLRHSKLLSTCRSVFYLSNEFTVTSRDLIDMMLQAGDDEEGAHTYTYIHIYTIPHSAHTRTHTQHTHTYMI
jgi:hypothetical protein